MQKCLRLLPLHLMAMAWLCPVIAAEKPSAISAGNAYYQLEELTLKNVFRQTEDRFGISIAYKSDLVRSRKVKLDLAQYHSPEEVLQKALAPFNLSFEKVRERFYLVTEKRMPEGPPTPALPLIQQQRTLHGKVTDKSGAPLPGVTIKVKGTSNGTLTNAEGNYSLGISGNGAEILQVSYVGYETLELPVGTNDQLNITLHENTSSLNEVVVTGYTAQRKKDLTGAVTVVKVADLNKQPTAQIENQLQGQASGVTVIGSGQPGQAPMVRIRGVNTFGNNTPLYVVDGVPTQNINDLNPNDVASMQVLKDAGAASIYGSRASNGVIIITTKRGSGKVKVQYDAYYGRQYPKGGNVWHSLNPQEMANLRWMAYHNSGISNPADTLYGSGPQPVLPDYLLPVGLKEGDPRTNPSLYNVNPDYTDADDYNNFYRITKANKAGTDWYHEAFRPAPITSHNISVSGGGDRGNYLFSLSYFNQQGTLMNTYLKRYTIRSNSQFNITDKIRVGENLAVSVSDNPSIETLTSDNAVSMTYRQQPIIPVYDIRGNFAGSYGIGLGEASNPVAMQYRTRNNRGQKNRVFGNIYGEADFLKFFTFRTSFGGEVYSGWDHTFTYPTYENRENSSLNSYTENSSNGQNWTWTNTLSFHHTFNGLHDLKLLVGTEAYDERGRTLNGTTQDFFTFDPDYVDNSTGSGNQTAANTRFSNALVSLIGRLDYVFNDKYLLGATLRRDGSSKLLNHRYGWFPAVSAAWRISQEDFMKGLSWLTDLKIRGGWGIMGNQFNLSPYNAYTLYNGNKNRSYYDLRGTNNSILLGFQPYQIGNPDAKWESDVNTNIGIDASLFGGKLEISADYYQKNIKDLLFNPELPGTYGVAQQPYANVANMENHGIDITIGTHTNLTKDLQLDATLTFTTYKNKIKKIADGVEYFDADGRRFEGSTIIRNAAGHPVSAFFGYKVAGFWNDESEITAANAEAQKATGNADAIYQTDASTGRFRYADINHDGQITADDRTFLGDPNPDISYGINLGLKYKNFDFSIFLYGVHGNQIWNNVKWWTDFYSSFNGAKSQTALYDSWRPDHKNATAPIQENAGSFSTNNVPNSYFVDNGAYLRAKNLQLGYTLPATLISRLHVERLRVYVQAANLFTITKYKGIDPEIGGAEVTDFGVDEGAYPSQREFLVGINLSF